MMAMRYQIPRHPIQQLREEMDRVLTGFLGHSVSGLAPSVSRGHPPVNMWEEGDRLMVELEAPGLKEDQLELAVAGGELSIRVSRPEEPEPGVTYHRRERPMGTFARVIRLPADIDSEKVDATLHDGVLTVTLPKSEGARPRKIEVSSA